MPIPKRASSFPLRAATLALSLALAGPALAQEVRPGAGSEPASPALVDHLVSVLVRREQPASGPFGNFQSPMAAFDSERQLRGLGARAAAAAPRIAELLLRTEKHAYDLGWTLWSISPEPAASEVPALAAAVESAQGAERLQALGKLGRTKAAAAVPHLRQWSRAEEAAVRLMAGLALGFQVSPEAGQEPALGLAEILKDKDKAVRSVAANGLRLLGVKASPAAGALIDYLRTGDNPFMASRALAGLPLRDVLPAKADLEAVVADKKLSDYQKEAAVQLLVRIESMQGAQPVAPVPAPSSTPLPQPGTPARPTAAGTAV